MPRARSAWWPRRAPAPAAGPAKGTAGGGAGPAGSFNVTPPEPATGAPPGFDNQDVARNRRPPEPKARTFVHADLMPDCDINCGGDRSPGAGGDDPYFATARLRSENKTGVAA